MREKERDREGVREVMSEVETIREMDEKIILKPRKKENSRYENVQVNPLFLYVL